MSASHRVGTRTYDALHHEDGTHRTTAASADGHALELHEAAIREHLADGHQHVVFPRLSEGQS